jgi:hypothetical protein
MRALLTVAALVLGVGAASAQTRVTSANMAQPAAAPILVTDRASFPRQIERGDVIVEMRVPASETRRFNDANAREHALEPMTLPDGRKLFCGAALPSAALAAQLPAGFPLPPMCFRDSDNDGAADQLFSVISGQPRFGAAVDNGSTISPRPWETAASAEQRVQYRYGGAQMGRVGEGGRLAEGAVEVSVVTSTSAEQQGLGGAQTRKQMLIGCLADGRCTPLPVSIDPIFALANPTVEGAVEVRLISMADAIASAAK